MLKHIKYLGITLTNKNSIRKEIQSSLKSGNVWYHLGTRLLSSSLPSKNIKIKIYIDTIFPVVLYGCESWSLVLREGRGIMVYKNRVLRKIFGPKM
jgi:hypothetical protein